MLSIRTFGATDTGLRRSQNEDSYVVNAASGLVALADGMGGAAAGEVASRIFTDTAVEVFSAGGCTEQEALAKAQEVFRLANERILSDVTRNPSRKGMGCTAELIAFHDEGYVLGHVGDSRSYLYRRGALRQLTRDHSVIQDQIDQGLITPEKAKSHSLRNVILRAVGTNESLAVDFIRGKNLPGDIFLVCSDGLSDMIEDESIRDALARPVSLERRASALIELANAAGGYDNVTVVLCEVPPSP